MAKGELGLSGILGVVGVVPAEAHGAGLVGEGQLVGRGEAGIGGHGTVVHHILQQLESLDVVLAVGGVGGPVLIDKVVGIQVVDEAARYRHKATVDNARSIDVDGTAAAARTASIAFTKLSVVQVRVSSSIYWRAPAASKAS